MQYILCVAFYALYAINCVPCILNLYALYYKHLMASSQRILSIVLCKFYSINFLKEHDGTAAVVVLTTRWSASCAPLAKEAFT